MEKLVKFRKAKGWSQKKLSDESGVSQTYISELEANKKQPTVIIAQKLALALNVTLSDLISENLKSPPIETSLGGDECLLIDNLFNSIHNQGTK